MKNTAFVSKDYPGSTTIFRSKKAGNRIFPQKPVLP